jgi:hypothetical protein
MRLQRDSDRWPGGTGTPAGRPDGGFRTSYRLALRRGAGAAAIPYGYTILNATAAGLLIRTHGPPTLAGAVLFLCGAVAAFTAVSSLGGTGVPRSAASGEVPARWLGLCSGVAAAGGLGVSALLVHVIRGPAAFGAVALAATSVYLTVAALGAALLAR